jgi:hypothetical protein
MTTGSIIQIAIIVVAVLLAGYFFYTRVLKSDLPDEMGAEWICRSCNHVFYMTPAKMENLEKEKKIRAREGYFMLQCPKCDEWDAFRAFKCPSCGGYYTLLDKVNNQLVCPHCQHKPSDKVPDQESPIDEDG